MNSSGKNLLTLMFDSARSAVGTYVCGLGSWSYVRLVAHPEPFSIHGSMAGATCRSDGNLEGIG